jgi:outer membrane PBP1 activator LpoA protein
MQRFPRLYALGMDAYKLTSLVALLRGNSGLQVEGRTGRLTMDASGVIHRELVPAHFVDGLLQPLTTHSSPAAAQHIPAGNHHD